MSTEGTVNRLNYIDNIRSLVIILLFPFHTFRMFTHFEPFYVQGSPQLFCDGFIAFNSIWFMNLLFALAGFVHQTVLVVIGYYVIKYIPYVGIQIFLILVGGFVGSMIVFHILKVIPVVNILFGMQKGKPSNI